ncbi:tripartite tricarboxylate transporter TctB family protein [Pseudarthrobacter oxydans]|uniref:tripartite tricarboxylate transporter TctB family protein n=1 Tax=Pseudarthrobacter oxydans TaxID=1671 RepID=UPI003806A5F8
MNDHTATGPPAGLNPTDPEQDHAEAHIHPVSEVLVTDRAHRLRELVPAAVTIGLGVLILVLAQGIRSGVRVELGPPFWPTMLAWSLIVLGVLQVVVNVLRGVSRANLPDPLSGWGIGRMLLTAVILVGYLLLWNVLQFWLITFATSVALTALYGGRGWRPLLVFPAIVTAVLHFLFVVALRVNL